MIDKATFEQIKPGARVRVFSAAGASLKGDKKRAAAETTSMFEGLVIARKHGNEEGGTFTVRAVLAGVSVEKIFPVGSPNIIKIKIISSPKKVHRSKLYFVRDMPGKKIRKKLGVTV